MPVYFIRSGDDGPVKIGWANNVEARRKGLQTGHYEPLRVIRVIEGNRSTEQWLQERFEALQLVGEWFRFHPDMVVVDPPVLGQPIEQRGPKSRPVARVLPWEACWPGNPCQRCLEDPSRATWRDDPRFAQHLKATAE